MENNSNQLNPNSQQKEGPQSIKQLARNKQQKIKQKKPQQQQANKPSKNNKKTLIKRFLEEGQKVGQIFKQQELEYKTFLIEGQKIPGFDRSQFAYWNGYLMSTQNLQSIYDFEGNMEEYESYIQELRSWEEEFFRIFEESQKNPQGKIKSQKQQKQYKNLKNHQDYTELSMVLEKSARQEIDHSQNFELIRKSQLQAQDFNISKVIDEVGRDEEDDDYLNSDDVNQTGLLDENNDCNVNMGNSNEKSKYNNQNSKQSNGVAKHGLVLPESQKIQLHPNLKPKNLSGSQQLGQNKTEKDQNGEDKCLIF